MRLGAVLGLVVALVGAGCGGARIAQGPATQTAVTTTSSVAAGKLRVGVVGPLTLDVAGATAEHGTLAQVSSAPLVLVSAGAAGLAAVADAARAHPTSHFAFVGASTKTDRVANLVGLVIRDDQAARLAGIVAGYAAADLGGTAPRVAWVGPQDRRLANAFAHGVHHALPSATVLDEWSRSIPGRCKEAALAGIERGAMVVVAARGLCADAAIAGARQRNVLGLQLGDFEFRNVVANLIVRDAAARAYHGDEDIVFGAGSGAIGVGRLAPRISFAALVRARAAAQELASAAP
jgi:hypothetical protein